MSRGKLGMLVRVLAVCGLLLFLGSVGLGAYLIFNTIKAVVSDTPVMLGASSHGYSHPCAYPFAVSSVNTPRLMTINDTQAVAVTITNSDTTACESRIYLDAIGFSVSSQGNLSQDTSGGRYVIVPPNKTITAYWIIKPSGLGTFHIGVAVEEIDAYDHAVTVVNIFGLNAWEAQLLSYLGTFLGPLLTVAWWYDKWQERKRRKSGKASLASTTKSPRPHRRTRQKR